MDNFEVSTNLGFKVTGGRGDYLVITFVGAYKAYKKGNIKLSQAELVINYNQLIYKGKVEL